jgi:serine/alanine adding enzyme
MSQETKTLHISRLTDDTCDSWDSYVRSASHGLPLHLSGWSKIMRHTYGYETCYIAAQDQEVIVGVLPLFLVPSLLTGKRAMTMPGAICADNKIIAAKLIEQAVKTSANAGIDRILLQDSRQELPDNWFSESDHVFWLVELDHSEDDLWKRLDGNIRRQVRKARNNDLKVEIDRSGELLDPFYDVFSRFTRQAGTPVFGRSFLENIIALFPNGFNIVVVWHEGRPIAGYFQLEMNETIYGMWGAALAETLDLRPAYLALWEIMREANQSGFSYLDMGRSPAGSNASKFKGQWGGTASPIYQTIINGKEHKPAHSVTSQVQSSEQFQLFMKIWPRLPLSLTQRLGPKLRWHIPFA